MKKNISLVLLALLITTAIEAQYDYAIGIRSGGTSGITLKNIITPMSAIEGIVGFWNDGLSFTVLYEQHPNAFDIEGLHWLFGAGAHVAFFEENYRDFTGPAWHNDYPDNIEDGEIGLGIDGMIGIEYKIPVLPLAFSAEIKPFIDFVSADEIWGSLDPGIGIKLAF
jgi:hypothetical protein